MAAVSAAILNDNGFRWVRPPELALPGEGSSPIGQLLAPSRPPELALPGEGKSPIGRLLAPSRVEQLDCMVLDRELRPLLRHYRLPRSGLKADLVERIYEYELTSGIAGGY